MILLLLLLIIMNIILITDCDAQPALVDDVEVGEVWQTIVSMANYV